MMRANTLRDLGLIVRERRNALGLGQADLAKRVGVSRQWIVEVEGGKARADAGLLLRTLRALDLELRVEPAAGGASPGGWQTGLPGLDIDAVVENARKGAGSG